jgi:hypothetical protein
LFFVLILGASGAVGPIWPSGAVGAVAAVFICDVLEPGWSGVMLNRSVSGLRGAPVELGRRLIDEGGPRGRFDMVAGRHDARPFMFT